MYKGKALNQLLGASVHVERYWKNMKRKKEMPTVHYCKEYDEMSDLEQTKLKLGILKEKINRRKKR